MEAGRNQALARVADALSALGYDLVVVPRAAKVVVVVTEADAAASSEQADGSGPT